VKGNNTSVGSDLEKELEEELRKLFEEFGID